MKAKHSALRAQQTRELASSFSLTEKWIRTGESGRAQHNRYPDLGRDLAPAFPILRSVAWGRAFVLANRGWSLYPHTVAQPSRNLTGFPDIALRRNPTRAGVFQRARRSYAWREGLPREKLESDL